MGKLVKNKDSTPISIPPISTTLPVLQLLKGLNEPLYTIYYLSEDLKQVWFPPGEEKDKIVRLHETRYILLG